MSETIIPLVSLRNMDIKIISINIISCCTTTPYEEPPVEPTDWEGATLTCMAMT
jgi:hypothetical protein